MSEDSERGTSTYPTASEMERRKSSDLAKRAVTVAAERGATASRTAASGLLSLLARRTGRSVEEIADGIPEDTIRRTKYPFNFQENEDGTLTFSDPKVVPGKQVISAPTSAGASKTRSYGDVEVKH